VSLILEIFFLLENNPIKSSDGTLNLAMLNISQTNYKQELLFSNVFFA